jgi:hypothetical protein
VAQEARGGAVPEVARPRAWYDGEAPELLGLADTIQGKQQKTTRGKSAPERQTGRETVRVNHGGRGLGEGGGRL